MPAGKKKYGRKKPRGASLKKTEENEKKPDQSSSKDASGIDPTELFPEEVKQPALLRY